MRLLIFDNAQPSLPAWLHSEGNSTRLESIQEIESCTYLTNLTAYQCCILNNNRSVFLPYDALTVSVLAIFKAMHNDIPNSAGDERYQSLARTLHRVESIIPTRAVLQTGTQYHTKLEKTYTSKSFKGEQIQPLVRRNYNGQLLSTAIFPITLRFPGSRVYQLLQGATFPLSKFELVERVSTPFVYNHDNTINDFYLDSGNVYMVKFRLPENDEKYWMYTNASSGSLEMFQPEFASFVSEFKPDITVESLMLAKTTKTGSEVDLIEPFSNLSGWLSKYIANEIKLNMLFKSDSDVARYVSSVAMAETISLCKKIQRLGVIISSISPFEINAYIDETKHHEYKSRFQEVGVFIE